MIMPTGQRLAPSTKTTLPGMTTRPDPTRPDPTRPSDRPFHHGRAGQVDKSDAYGVTGHPRHRVRGDRHDDGRRAWRRRPQPRRLLRPPLLCGPEPARFPRRQGVSGHGPARRPSAILRSRAASAKVDIFRRAVTGYCPGISSRRLTPSAMVAIRNARGTPVIKGQSEPRLCTTFDSLSSRCGGSPQRSTESGTPSTSSRVAKSTTLAPRSPVALG